MLHELDYPAFVEIIEKAADVGVQNIVHLLLQKRIRQRIQRIMLAAPRAKAIREAEKVFLVNLVEDGDHSLLDNLVLQRRDPQRTLSSVGFLYTLYRLFWMASLDKLRDELGYAGRRVDPPRRFHTPTL